MLTFSSSAASTSATSWPEDLAVRRRSWHALQHLPSPLVSPLVFWGPGWGVGRRRGQMSLMSLVLPSPPPFLAVTNSQVGLIISWLGDAQCSCKGSKKKPSRDAVLGTGVRTLWWPLLPHPHIPVDTEGRSEAPRPFHCWSGRPLGEWPFMGSSCGYPTLGFLEAPLSSSGSQVLSSAFESMKVWQTDVGRAVLLPRGAGLLARQCWHCWKWLTLSRSEWHSVSGADEKETFTFKLGFE